MSLRNLYLAVLLAAAGCVTTDAPDDITVEATPASGKHAAKAGPPRFCPVDDTACIPFSLSGAARASRSWATDNFPAAKGIDVTCSGGSSVIQCDIHVDLGPLKFTAGCALWSDGSLDCGVESDAVLDWPIDIQTDM